jgi:hypothetical protein
MGKAAEHERARGFDEVLFRREVGANGSYGREGVPVVSRLPCGMTHAGVPPRVQDDRSDAGRLSVWQILCMQLRPTTPELARTDAIRLRELA